MPENRQQNSRSEYVTQNAQTDAIIKKPKFPLSDGINPIARLMLSSGMTVSESAKILGVSYQRIKNVEKRMKKKTDNEKTRQKKKQSFCG